MKIGFTAKGQDWTSRIDPRFGRAEYLLVYDEEQDEFVVFDNAAIAEQQHGAGPGTSKKLFEMNAEVLITGNGPGDNAAKVLRKVGIDIYTGAEGMTIKEAYVSYTKNELNNFNQK